ncbi:MAG: hypothetical protein LUE99_18235 [Bacteroides sp.]|nr:hypothetical protein [Bacteroides sp.]
MKQKKRASSPELLATHKKSHLGFSFNFASICYLKKQSFFLPLKKQSSITYEKTSTFTLITYLPIFNPKSFSL